MFIFVEFNRFNHWDKVLIVSVSMSERLIHDFSKVRTGDGATFVPEDGRPSIAGGSMVSVMSSSFQFRFDAYPKTPQPVPTGEVEQMLVRIEDPRFADYICYVDDDKGDYRFINAIRTITDLPIVNGWATWLKKQSAIRGYWGVCNHDTLNTPDTILQPEDFGKSMYGMQFRWITNDATIWDDIVYEGLKFKKIELPKEV